MATADHHDLTPHDPTPHDPTFDAPAPARTLIRDERFDLSLYKARRRVTKDAPPPNPKSGPVPDSPGRGGGCEPA